MPGPLVDLLVVVAAIGIVLYFFVLQPLGQRAQRNAHLGALAGVLSDGRVGNGHVYGTYAGHAIEAWPYKQGLGRSSSIDLERVPGDTFTIKFHGVAGGHYWRCTTHLSLNPFNTPEPILATDMPASAGLLGRMSGLHIGHDAALEERLRTAGLLTAIGELHANSPHLRLVYQPSAVEVADARLSRLAGFAGFSPQLAEQLVEAGRIDCTLQAPGGVGPTPERFREQLEVLERIARVNAQANPSAEPRVAEPSANRPTPGRDLADAVLGSWSNDLVALTFERGGALAILARTRGGGGRQQRAAGPSAATIVCNSRQTRCKRRHGSKARS